WIWREYRSRVRAPGASAVLPARAATFATLVLPSDAGDPTPPPAPPRRLRRGGKCGPAPRVRRPRSLDGRRRVLGAEARVSLLAPDAALPQRDRLLDTDEVARVVLPRVGAERAGVLRVVRAK